MREDPLWIGGGSHELEMSSDLEDCRRFSQALLGANHPSSRSAPIPAYSLPWFAFQPSIFTLQVRILGTSPPGCVTVISPL